MRYTDGFEQRALYDPTGPMEWAGPVGESTLEAYAYDKAVLERLSARSEKDSVSVWDI
mgnify:CR=1 FL=1|jgi:hypothetical protein|tara:strand:- start:2582 stop:2755 length:174 start_codon:yes stop_codon:yes gene_type:complete